MNSGAWALGGMLSEAVITVTPPQLLALAEKPVTLIAGPGAGKANIIVAMSASLEFAGTAYTNPGSAAGNVIYNGPSQLAALASNNLAALLVSSASEVEVLASIATTLARSEVEAQAILLSNPGADFTLGNGVLVLSIVYATVTL